MKIQSRYQNVAQIYRDAARQRIVSIPDHNALNRARRIYRKNLIEPGDFKNDPAALVGLAIAQADQGMYPGWIPVVQKLGIQIADMLNGMIVQRGGQ